MKLGNLAKEKSQENNSELMYMYYIHGMNLIMISN